MIKRTWVVLTWLFSTLWQTRHTNGSRWLAMIANYQDRRGGRSSLADPEGSYSQRIAHLTLTYGAFFAIVSTVMGSMIHILGGHKNDWPSDPFKPGGFLGLLAIMGRFERGGW